MMKRRMKHRPSGDQFDWWLDLLFALVIKPTVALVRCVVEMIFGDDSRSGCGRKGGRR